MQCLNNFQVEHTEWEKFQESVCDYFSRLEPAAHDRKFYLKVRSKDAGLQSCPAGTVKKCLKSLPLQYKEMYCVVAFGTEDLGVFLMKDCGDKVDNNTFATHSFRDFCSIFGKFWKETMSLCDAIFHGDALPHNFVYNEKSNKLALIDLDEGVHEADAPERVFEDIASLQYPYLRYPNFLRSWSEAKLYTQIQLLASFMLLVDSLDSLNEEETRAVEKLHDVTNTAEEYLQSKNDKVPSCFQPETHPYLDDAVAMCANLLLKH